VVGGGKGRETAEAVTASAHVHIKPDTTSARVARVVGKAMEIHSFEDLYSRDFQPTYCFENET